MGGFVTVAITIFVIWFLGKVMAEKPDDAIIQDGWHRFKRKFRTGRIYHLFAARTRERLWGGMYVFYLSAGMGLLIGTDIFVSDVFQYYIPLDQMEMVQGTLLQFTPTKNDCGHVSIKVQQDEHLYSICYDRSEYKGISRLIGRQVTAWTTQENTLFNGSGRTVNQLQNQDEMVVKYRVDSKESFSHTRFLLLCLSIFCFALSALGVWGAARRNIRDFGPWQGLDKGE
jgi:hypothetical protein